MSVMGKHGMQQVANLCYQKAHYAAAQIAKLDGYEVWNGRPFFHEFVVKCPRTVARVNEHLVNEHDIIGGYDLGKDYPDLQRHMLLCCTETNTKEEIDELVEALAEIA
jgi:glycine dehydrogenase subunit 1